MTYTEKEARALVIEAGHRLLASGLTARTWGNISARISNTQFVITPSGLAYETLRSDQLVVVNIDDCSYEGNIKPSSEKGIHAAAYRLRPDIGFVIHTHQDYACAVGVSGQDLTELGDAIPGGAVPCAPYGLPGTKKLCRGVERAILNNPQCRAFLMHCHGALCLGQDLDRTFEVAEALERVCRDLFEKAVTPGSSESSSPSGLLNELKIAATGQHFSVGSDPYILAAASRGKTLRPYLDDLAQIAGVSIRCAKNDPTAIMNAMKGRNAVLVSGIGAVCCAEDPDDLAAIETILRKGCMAALYAGTPKAKPLSPLDCALMRFVYKTKYSRKKSGG